MPSASFVYTTPVARSSISGVLLGSPITIDIGSGLVAVPYSQRDAGGPIPGTDAKLQTTLTAADINSILGRRPPSLPERTPPNCKTSSRGRPPSTALRTTTSPRQVEIPTR